IGSGFGWAGGAPARQPPRTAGVRPKRLWISSKLIRVLTPPNPTRTPGASRPRAPLGATLTATFFGTGRLKPGPGTWGSLATVILWALASLRIPVADRVWATIIAAA